MFFLVTGTVTSGTDEGVTPSIQGLPAGTSISFPNLAKFCCGTFLYQITGSSPVRLSTTSTTPTGSYILTVAYTSRKSGVTRTVHFTLYVDPIPSPLQKGQFPPDVPLTSLAQWQAHMTTYGRYHCTPAEQSLYDGFVWYYDGERVYYQIADYTKDSATWTPCALMVQKLYRDYVITNSNGWEGGAGIPGYRVFAQGLAMNFQRTEDAISKGAVSALAKSTYAAFAYPNSGVSGAGMIDWSVSRETAYAIEAQLAGLLVGDSLGPGFQDLVELSLGHMSQWFLDENAPYVQPFMVALTAEALIDYWNQTQDVRVPVVLKSAADELWRNSWDSIHLCFNYYNDTNGTVTISTSQDLNLLIAPLYGWVYQQTGLQQYRDEGDAIFNAGVVGAYLGYYGTAGKQFSQNYRWSFRYVEWRQGASVISGGNVPSANCDLNGDGVVNILDVQLATNQAIGRTPCTNGDVDHNGACNNAEVQIIIGAALGNACTVP